MIVYKTKNNKSFFIDGISIPSAGLPIESESDRRFNNLENLVKVGFIIRADSVETNSKSKSEEMRSKTDEENSKLNLKLDDKSNLNLKTKSNLKSNLKLESKIDENLKNKEVNLKSNLKIDEIDLKNEDINLKPESNSESDKTESNLKPESKSEGIEVDFVKESDETDERISLKPLVINCNR